MVVRNRKTPVSTEIAVHGAINHRFCGLTCKTRFTSGSSKGTSTPKQWNFDSVRREESRGNSYNANNKGLQAPLASVGLNLVSNVPYITISDVE